MGSKKGEVRFLIQQYRKDPGPAIQHASKVGEARVFDEKGQLAAVVRVPVRRRKYD
jgi:hypothetical protein